MKSRVYIARNKVGWICGYDRETHRCIDAILSTGDDIDYYNKHYDEWIGQLDPAYEKQLKGGNSKDNGKR